MCRKTLSSDTLQGAEKVPLLVSILEIKLDKWSQVIEEDGLVILFGSCLGQFFFDRESIIICNSFKGRWVNLELFLFLGLS